MRVVYSCGVLSHAPSKPAHVPWIDDPHLNLVEHRNSPNDTESKATKQRDTACVARADARHEGRRPDAERVTRVGQEKRESRMRAALSTVRRLCKVGLIQRGVGNRCSRGARTGYHHLTLDLKFGVVALMLEKEVHVADHGQCLDVVVRELEFGAVVVVRNAAIQRASEHD